MPLSDPFNQCKLKIKYKLPPPSKEIEQVSSPTRKSYSLSGSISRARIKTLSMSGNSPLKRKQKKKRPVYNFVELEKAKHIYDDGLTDK